MMSKHSLTQERLRYLLDYDPESGLFSWKNPQSKRCKVGQVAGSVDGGGYVQISIDGKRYKAHRLAHLHMTGEFPENEVDHINRVKTDNRWSNLREATSQQNKMNSYRADKNTSGKKGVSWNKQMDKWMAYISVDGKNYHLGYYNDIEDAATAYATIAKILHGEFSHLGEQL